VLVLKVLDRNGSGYTSDVIQAIEFIVANQRRFNIDVINLSLGHPIFEPAATDPLVAAVQKATQAGIIVVVAAGNYGQNPTTGQSGYAGITSPGNAPSAITVGAVDTQDSVGRGDDTIPVYSSRGPTWYDAYAKPDLVAPGHRLVSIAARRGTLYQMYPDLRVSSGGSAVAPYFRLSGTSMAAAVATGAVALVLDAAGDNRRFVTPNLVKAILQWSAIPIPGYDSLTQGSGALNAAGALALIRALNLTAPTDDDDDNSFVSTFTPSTTIGGVVWPWAKTVVWGNTIGYGAIDANQQAWKQTVVWGNTVVWSSTVVWGSNVVWSDPGVWSSTVVWGNNLIGTTDGTTVVWGNAKTSMTTVVWGNLAGALDVSGNGGFTGTEP
jgi:hypothetical protein